MSCQRSFMKLVEPYMLRMIAPSASKTSTMMALGQVGWARLGCTCCKMTRIYSIVDAFLYFYYPGDEIDDTGGGVYVPLTEDSDAYVTPLHTFINVSVDLYFTEGFSFQLEHGTQMKFYGSRCRKTSL